MTRAGYFLIALAFALITALALSETADAVTHTRAIVRCAHDVRRKDARHVTLARFEPDRRIVVRYRCAQPVERYKGWVLSHGRLTEDAAANVRLIDLAGNRYLNRPVIRYRSRRRGF